VENTPEINPDREDFIRLGHSIINLSAIAYVTYEGGENDLWVYLNQKNDKGKRLYVRVAGGPLADEVFGFFISRTAFELMPKQFREAKVDVPIVQATFLPPLPPPPAAPPRLGPIEIDRE
jgi:hypothetical protein